MVRSTCLSEGSASLSNFAKSGDDFSSGSSRLDHTLAHLRQSASSSTRADVVVGPGNRSAHCPAGYGVGRSFNDNVGRTFGSE